MNWWQTVLVAAAGCGAFWSCFGEAIKGLCNRVFKSKLSTNKRNAEEVKSTLKALEDKLDSRHEAFEQYREATDKSLLRIQLMELIGGYPSKANDINNLARTYFIEKQGNSFMGNVYKDWLKAYMIDKGLSAPDWWLDYLEAHPEFRD